MKELREILQNFLVGNIRTVEDCVLAIEKTGYRLVPELKVLSDEEIQKAFDGDFEDVVFDHKPTVHEIMLIKLKLVAQAQRDADKKFYYQDDL